jgi:CPA2 family monovalent cation:H+ antiporter-2
LFANLLIILSCSLLVIALFRRLSLPPVLGYLSVGLLIGPNALNWLSDAESLPHLAEMGVVFLLFSLGLEFSLSRVLALRHVVFVLGSLQVAVTGALLAGLLIWLQLPIGVALVLGVGLALSSTAIVSKELGSLGEIFSRHGQNAIGVLLFQDLVAVLLLTLLPALTAETAGLWYVELGLTLGKACLLFLSLFLVSRWVLPRLFHEVASARSAELFVTLALVIVLLTAWLTHWLGLSMALGAFLAGMLLGESHYRHQIEADIRPFRDILLGLFFVSVGMLIDPHLFLSQGALIVALTLALMLLKGGVVALLVRLRGGDTATAWRSGLALAQGGEFCFALMTQIEQAQLLPGPQAKLLLAATFCSMALTPLLLRMAPAVAARLQRQPRRTVPLDEISQAAAQVQGHVVICGYGRVGQSIGRFLHIEQQVFIALDDDPVRVQEAAAGESNVHYGDCSRADLLQAVGLQRARLLVVAVDNVAIALRIVQQARALHADLPILVRTRDDNQQEQLLAAGASEVVPEVLESSLMLASHALVLLGVPQLRVQQRMDSVRRGRYKLLHGYYQGGDDDLLDEDGAAKLIMRAVNLHGDAYACGQSLDALGLEQLGLEVHSVRRAGEDLPLTAQLPLCAGDALLLSGKVRAIEAGEALLLGGLR